MGGRERARADRSLGSRKGVAQGYKYRISKGFLFSDLLGIAPYCAPGGIRVVSKEMHSCSTIVLTRNEHPKDAQHLAGHGSIQSTLDRYSHRIPRALCHLGCCYAAD